MRYYFYMNLLQKFEALRPFTEAEAWALFRIAAIAEACGWTLLIIGISVNKYITPHNSTVLILAGRTHGMLFLLYLIAAFGLYPSLGWLRWRAIVALAFSVPPYGTLVFEQWASVKRRNGGFKSYQQYLVYTVLTAAAA